jgi:hypothetical protein
LYGRLVIKNPPFYFFFLDFPALLNAMATACLVGRPSFLRVLMLALTAFLLLPFLSGISPITSVDGQAEQWHQHPCGEACGHEVDAAGYPEG